MSNILEGKPKSSEILESSKHKPVLVEPIVNDSGLFIKKRPENTKLCSPIINDKDYLPKGDNEETAMTTPFINNLNEYLQVCNFLSEFVSEAAKARVRHNLGIDNLPEGIWGKIKGDIFKQKDLIDLFKRLDNKKIDSALYEMMLDASNHKYISPELEGVTTVKEALDMISYKDLNITKFSCTPNIVEKGIIVNSVTCSWEYNKKIQKQLIDGIELDNNTRKYTYNNTISNNRIFTLSAFDSKVNKTRITYLNFVAGRYYGVSKNTNITDSSYIINNFTRSLTLNKNSSFTVTANKDEYIYLLVPYDMNNISFWVGGFEGGFELLNNNFIFNRYKDTNIRCCLFRSEKASLGKTTITIK